MAKKSALIGLFVYCMVFSAVAESWPEGGYMQENTTYTGAATQDNLGVSSNTPETPVIANAWFRISAGNYLDKDKYLVTTCPAGSYCPGGDYAFHTEANTPDNSGLYSCPTNWTSAEGAEEQTDCTRSVVLNKSSGSGTLSGTNVTDTSGGTSNASIKCYYNQTCTFPATAGVLTASGYTYNNQWNTTSDCTSGSTSAQITNTSSNVTYYACKNGDVYTVTLDPDYEGGNVNYIYVRHNTGVYSDSAATTAISSITPPTRACYDFLGFYTSATNQWMIDSQGTINSSALKGITSDTDLFADWSPYTTIGLYDPVAKQYVKYLYYNTNTFTDDECSTVYNANTNEFKLNKTGYTFGGYYCNEFSSGNEQMNSDCQELNDANDGLGTQVIDANGKLTNAYFYNAIDCLYDTSLTFTAKMTPKTYTITFDVSTNGGTTTPAVPSDGTEPEIPASQTSSVTATYDANMPTISTTPPTKTGYIFTGWYNQATGGTKYYNEKGASAKKWNIDADTKLYAQWKQGIYIKWYNVSTKNTIIKNWLATHDFSIEDEDKGIVSSVVEIGDDILTPRYLKNSTGFLGWKFVKPAQQ